jgi:hypothetical protein
MHLGRIRVRILYRTKLFVAQIGSVRPKRANTRHRTKNLKRLALQYKPRSLKSQRQNRASDSHRSKTIVPRRNEKARLRSQLTSRPLPSANLNQHPSLNPNPQSLSKPRSRSRIKLLRRKSRLRKRNLERSRTANSPR